MVNFLAASSTNWVMLAVLGVLLVGVFIFPMLTNKKRGKQINDMRTTLRLGDEVMTIGGIVGKVVEIIETSPIDKDFVIETGAEGKKSTMIFDIRALHENRTRMKEIQAEAAARAEQQKTQHDAKHKESEERKQLTNPEHKEERPKDDDKTDKK